MSIGISSFIDSICNDDYAAESSNVKSYKIDERIKDTLNLISKIESSIKNKKELHCDFPILYEIDDLIDECSAESSYLNTDKLKKLYIEFKKNDISKTVPSFNIQNRLNKFERSLNKLQNELSDENASSINKNVSNYRTLLYDGFPIHVLCYDKKED